MSFAPHYPRDLRGYGRNPVQADWPGGARIAVQFVLNCEEGGENCVLHGDPTSEQFLSKIVGADAYPARHMSMESIYEYGSRAGVWRILREFERRELPLTLFGIGMALERNPEVAHACIELGHEIACHGWRWIHYQALPPELDQAHPPLRRRTGTSERHPSARLVHRPRQSQYTPPGRRTWRLLVQLGLLRRRPALLDRS